MFATTRIVINEVYMFVRNMKLNVVFDCIHSKLMIYQASEVSVPHYHDP